jgi:2-polyprenyl-6-methoxyphenol hydroxylase-like FAD-dependent oxidoreductase
LRIACVGGGPAGLTAALMLKLREPRHDVTVFERSVPGAARGWGVSLWRDSLEKLYLADPESAREIEQASYCWDSHVVDVGGNELVYGADRGYGITRQHLTDALSRRALAAGARIEYARDVTDASQLPGFDLVVACDGGNSRIRQASEGFHADVQLGGNKYLWLGTDKFFENFIYSFVETDSGWIWAGAHSCGAQAESGTFIVECSTETWAGLGFDTMPLDDCLLVLEKIFDHHLHGHHLMGRSFGEANAQWLNFRAVTNENWYDGNIVLVGDAAHTTHFSIGSGTKLAIEDAIALADNLDRYADITSALEAYQAERRIATLPNQITARLSAQFFENIPRYIDLKPRPFVTLLRRRRSPLLPYLPPRLGYLLYPTSRDIPLLRNSGRWVARGGIKVHNRLTGSRLRAGVS